MTSLRHQPMARVTAPRSALRRRRTRSVVERARHDQLCFNGNIVSNLDGEHPGPRSRASSRRRAGLCLVWLEAQESGAAPARVETISEVKGVPSRTPSLAEALVVAPGEGAVTGEQLRTSLAELDAAHRGPPSDDPRKPLRKVGVAAETPEPLRRVRDRPDAGTGTNRQSEPPEPRRADAPPPPDHAVGLHIPRQAPLPLDETPPPLRARVRTSEDRAGRDTPLPLSRPMPPHSDGSGGAAASVERAAGEGDEPEPPNPPSERIA